MGQTKYQHDFGEIRCHPKELEKPKKWRKPRRVFVNSMGDLFHKDVPDWFIDSVFERMADTPQHNFQILTKRPQRARLYTQKIDPPLNHVWIGVSASNQQELSEAFESMMGVRARIRFLSLEPLLAPVRIQAYNTHIIMNNHIQKGMVDWVIVGCESGPHRRPCNLNWIRSVRDQCLATGTPLFIKQVDIGGKIVKMPKIDGVVWGQYPENV
jgi:protein gp37